MIKFKQLMFDKGLNQSDLAELWGISQSLVSKVVRGERGVPKYYIDKLIERYGVTTIEQYTIPDITPQAREATTTMLSPETIEEAKQLGCDEVRGGDVIEVDAEDIKKFSLPFVTNDIAQAPNTDIKAMVINNSPKLGRYPIGQKLSGVSYAQRIITEAMAGANFFPGDIIFLTYLDKSQMISDSAYLIDTKDYGTLFRLVTIEKNGLLLRPCNEDPERFKPIFVREDEVLSYAALVMQIRTSFSFSNGTRLAEMVKSRDEQIMTLTTSQRDLITAQAQVLHNQAELIAEIRDERKHSRELTNKLLKNM